MAEKMVRVLSKEEAIAEVDLVIDFQFLVQDLAETSQLSRTELADRIGISKARLSQLLGSGANPTLHNVARILHALGEKASISVKRKNAKRSHEKIAGTSVVANTNTFRYEEPSQKARLKSASKTDLALMAIGGHFTRNWVQEESCEISNDCHQIEDDVIPLVAA